MQEDNKITDKEYWDNYWSNYQYDSIPKKLVFEKYMPLISKGNDFIEIGGFPGLFAAAFYLRGIKDITILDFYINKDLIRNFEIKNNLPEGTIKYIESDFFDFKSEKKYDTVFSYGFIEHFENTTDVINRHINLMSENGKLLIIIPNFLGLNGKIQQQFDKQNLDAHNLNAMDINSLKEIMKSFNLNNCSVEYIGKPMVWIEPKPENLKKRKWVKLLSYLVKLFPIKGKFLSPFVAIYAER
jgi:2-polyprenyl-3-methyl-5-hydroxy-6-metoxy-1,4-benzoquinol methylase